jgi:hypothetical protein
MKNLLLFVVTTLVCNSSFAQQQTSAKTIVTDYQKTTKLNAGIKPQAVYSLTENWFNANPAMFTTKNAEAPETSKTKNKKEVEEAYDNKRPLQSLDPAVNRVLGQGLVKYFGGTKTSIRLLYIKYDITIQATAGQVVFKVSNVRYFHFDPKSYTEAGIYSFNGGKPCDYTGTMEYLKGCQVSSAEFTALTAFFNKTVTDLNASYIKALKEKKMANPGTATKPAASKGKTAGKK